MFDPTDRLRSALAKLKRIKRAHHKASHTKAPHKPILLLAVAELFETGALYANRIDLSAELIVTFQTLWSRLVPAEQAHWQARIYLPFYHLSSDGFWHLEIEPGHALVLSSSYSPKSTSALQSSIDFAWLDSDVYACMADSNVRKLLQEWLINTFFPHASIPMNAVREESQTVLQAARDEVLSGFSLDSDEGKSEVRGALFKQEVPRIYRYQCAISGMHLMSDQGYGLLDACHIQPWSVARVDVVQNGICLTPTLHRAFDRGLITIDSSYRVRVRAGVSENKESPFWLGQFHGKQMALPEKIDHYPSEEYLHWHRTRWR